MPSQRKNRLLALENVLHGQPGKPRKRPGRRPKRGPRKRGPRKRGHQVRIRAQAFDLNEPIELTYNHDSDAYVADTDAYGVAQAHEEDTYQGSTEYQASAFTWDGTYSEEDTYPDGTETRQASAFTWGDTYPEEDTYPGDAEAYQASAFTWEDDDPYQAEAGAFEVEAFEDTGTEPAVHSGALGQAFSAVDLDEQALAEDLDFSDLDAAAQENTSPAASNREFAADLQAILSGQKTYDRDRGGMVSNDAPTETTTPSPAAPSPERSESAAASDPHGMFNSMAENMPHNQSTPLAQAKSQPAEDAVETASPHSVFDNMGHNMNYANSFDLGSIALDQRFDEFDQILDQEQRDQEQRQAPPQPSAAQALQKENNPNAAPPLALDEAALAADLALMRSPESQSSDYNAAEPALQLATERALVIKPPETKIRKYTKDNRGLANAVKTGWKSSVATVPFSHELSIDQGAELTKNGKPYVWANDGGKIGYICKNDVFPRVTGSFRIAAALNHPRMLKAFQRKTAAEQDTGMLSFYLAVDDLDPDDQAGAIRIFDEFLYDSEIDEYDDTYAHKKAQALNQALQQLNPNINPDYLLRKTDAEAPERPVNVGPARPFIQHNFVQLVHQNLFKKALFLQALPGSAAQLAERLDATTFQLDPNLTDIADNQQGSLMERAQENIRGLLLDVEARLDRYRGNTLIPQERQELESLFAP